MAIAQSKITSQRQTSVPLEVRRKLGLGPGSVLEWDDNGDTVTVRKAGRYTSDAIHQMVFPSGTGRRKPLKVLKQGIRKDIKKRHARD